MIEPDSPLWLKCCGASSKDECVWAPCPANVDAYTPEELRAEAEDHNLRVVLGLPDDWLIDMANRALAEDSGTGHRFPDGD